MTESTDDTRRRRRLDGLWLALLERYGTDELELLLLDADRHAAAPDWTSKRHELARDYAERLQRGRS